VAKNIYFDHIPKTGGTSFHQVLTSWYGDDRVSPTIASRRFADVMVQYKDFAAISGQMHYGLGDKLPEDRIKVTIIRDPIDRALSQYFYSKETRANRTTRDKEMYELSLEDFLSQSDDARLTEYSNVYSRHFAPLCAEFHTGSGNFDDSRLLQFAKEALSLFDVVGLFTDFEDFSAITAIRAGISEHVRPPKLNQTQNRPNFDRLSQHAIDLLRERNTIDLKLAEFAAERFRLQRTRTLVQSVSMSSNYVEAATTELEGCVTAASQIERQEAGSREIEIANIFARGSLSAIRSILTGEDLCIAVELFAHEPAEDLTVGIHISELSGVRVFGTNSRLLGMVLAIDTPGRLMVEFTMKCELGRGEFLVGATVHKGKTHLEKCYHWTNYSTSFTVLGALGWYFEGKTRLNPSVFVIKYGNTPAQYTVSENCREYPDTVMLQSPPLTEFKVNIGIENFNYQPIAGEIFNLESSISNGGTQCWPVAGLRPVSVCYHWLNSDRSVAVFDGVRTRLTSELSGGQHMRILVQVQAPYRSGDYILQITAVQEGVGWFDEKGCTPAEIPITVKA
jgi:hypothetical protein